MAKEFTPEFVEKLHTAMCDPNRNYVFFEIELSQLEPYYLTGDHHNFIAPLGGRHQQVCENSWVAALLMLAAEEELEGYPMETSNEA